MTKVNKIIAVRLHDRAYEEIKNGLITGAFPPGEIITVEPLAKDLGTSGQPVREALTRLVGEGILQQLPNRSVQVPLMSRKEFDEIIEARVLMEGTAAAKAAKNVTPELIRELEKHFAAMDKAIKRKSPKYYQHNHEFHFLIYRASASDVIFSIIERLWFRGGSMFRDIAKNAALLEERLSEGQTHHQELLDAIRSGSPSKAEQAIRDDILVAAKWCHQNYAFAEDNSR